MARRWTAKVACAGFGRLSLAAMILSTALHRHSFSQIASAPESIATFWTAVDAQHERLRDIVFHYEGELGVWKKDEFDRSGKEVYVAFNGDAKWHADGILYWNYYNHHPRSALESETIKKRKSRSINLRGSQRTIYEGANPIDRRQEEIPMQWSGLMDVFGPGVFWCVPRFALLGPDDRRLAQFIGRERIGGIECAVVQMRLPGIWSEQFRHEARYFVDLDRGANALRIDEMVNDKLLTQYRDIRLSAVRDAKGHEYWIPAAAFRDTFLKAETDQRKSSVGFLLQTTPTQSVSYRLLADSVRINTGVSAAEVELKFDPKFARTKPMTPAEAERASKVRHVPSTTTAKDVERVLEAAKQQQADIRQQARQSETDWLRIGTFGLAVAGLAGLILVWFLRRRAGS